jgi:hypothetical protein
MWREETHLSLFEKWLCPVGVGTLYVSYLHEPGRVVGWRVSNALGKWLSI